jgi:hypothetical protein
LSPRIVNAIFAVVVTDSSSLGQPQVELDRFMDALHKWCKRLKGRQKALAAELGVTEQVLSHWLCRRKMPSFAFGLRLQAYARQKGVVTEEATASPSQGPTGLEVLGGSDDNVVTEIVHYYGTSNSTG